MLLLPALIFLALHLRALDYDFVWTDQAEIEPGVVLRPPGDQGSRWRWGSSPRRASR